MTRLKDYLRFAVQFTGLGYVVLWPLSTPGDGGLFGAALLCGGRGMAALDLVCRMPHPLQLGVGLHVSGALCTLLAALHLGVCAVRHVRLRRPAAEPVAAEVAPARAQPNPRPRMRRPMPPPRKLARARSHFGLRGVPQ